MCTHGHLDLLNALAQLGGDESRWASARGRLRRRSGERARRLPRVQRVRTPRARSDQRGHNGFHDFGNDASGGEVSDDSSASGASFPERKRPPRWKPIYFANATRCARQQWQLVEQRDQSHATCRPPHFLRPLLIDETRCADRESNSFRRAAARADSLTTRSR